MVVVSLSGCAAIVSPTIYVSPTQHSTMPLTSAEAALGEKPVSLPGVPDSVLEKSSIFLTVAPGDRSTVTEAAAQETALSNARGLIPGKPKIIGYVLAELHYAPGEPPKGQLVWIFGLSSASGKTFLPTEGEPPGGAPRGSPDPITAHLVGATAPPIPASPRYVIVLVDASNGHLLVIT